MSNQLESELTAYLKLAMLMQKKILIPDRDRALILAGSCASLLGFESLAGFCRNLILQNNRGHMIGQYSSFKAALEASDFQVFLKQVAKRCSLEKAESILATQGLRVGPKQAECQNDFAFYCSLLEVEPDWVEENF